MRPIYLTVRGARSFLQPTEIDFSALGEYGLFGVFGDTGSGKSSIVDCMIFSLYGKVNNSDINLIDFINTKSDTADIAFRFGMRDPNGVETVYLIERKLKRGKQIDHRAELFVIESGDKRSLVRDSSKVSEEIAKLIGLSLGDFVNCIVLEQGQYDRFIKAPPKERKNMIGNIFNLQKYGDRLAAAVKEKGDAINAEINDKASRISEIGDVSETVVSALATALQEKTAAHVTARETTARAAAVLEGMRKASEQVAAADNLKQRLATERENAQKLALAQRAAIAALAAADESLQRLKKESEPRLAAITARLGALDANGALESEAKTFRETVARMKAELADTAQKAKNNRETLESGEAGLQKSLESVVRGLAKFEETYGLSLADETLPTINRLQEARVNLGSLLQQQKTAADAYVRLNADLTRLDRDRRAHALETERTRAERDAEQARLTAQDAEIAAAKEEKARLDALVNQAYLDNAVEAVAKNLREGDVCPVCGNRVAQIEPHAVQDIASRESAAAQSASKLDALCHARDKRADAVARYENLIVRAVADAERIDRETARITAEIAASGADGNTEARVKELEQMQAGFFKLAQKIAEDESRVRNARDGLTSTDADHIRLTERLADAENAHAGCLRKLSELLPQGGTISSNRTALTAEERQLRQGRERAEHALTVASESERKVTADAERSAQTVAAYERQLAEMPHVSFDAAVYDAAVQTHDRTKTEEEQLAAEVAVLTKDLKDARDRFARARALKSELAVAQHRRDLLETIRKMTNGNKMMEWIAEEFIEEFTLDASAKLLKLTNGEMELVYDKSGFWIVDNFNNGERRKVSTVSGGETFLVSLSLAVAISSSLERRASACQVEFLFIDEGFGTLSPNKIDAVLEALGDLGKQNFTVGFVSHVSQMQARMPRWLEVSRENPDIGSVVRLV